MSFGKKINRCMTLNFWKYSPSEHSLTGVFVRRPNGLPQCDKKHLGHRKIFPQVFLEAISYIVTLACPESLNKNKNGFWTHALRIACQNDVPNIFMRYILAYYFDNTNFSITVATPSSSTLGAIKSAIAFSSGTA